MGGAWNKIRTRVLRRPYLVAGVRTRQARTSICTPDRTRSAAQSWMSRVSRSRSSGERPTVAPRRKIRTKPWPPGAQTDDVLQTHERREFLGRSPNDPTKAAFNSALAGADPVGQFGHSHGAARLPEMR
jgi:hypothetical protein